MSKASPPLGVKVGIFTFVWYMWLNIWFQVLHTTGSVHIAVWETSIQESHRQRNCPGRVCMTYRKNSEKSHVRLSIELTADIKPISSPTFQCLLSLFFLCLKTVEIDFVKRSVNCARNVYMYGIYWTHKWNSWWSWYFLRDFCTVTLTLYITEMVTRWARD